MAKGWPRFAPSDPGEGDLVHSAFRGGGRPLLRQVTRELWQCQEVLNSSFGKNSRRNATRTQPVPVVLNGVADRIAS